MNANDYRAFGWWQLAWLLVIAAIALAAPLSVSLSALEWIFFVWFVGFLAGVELFAPRHVAPTSWTWVRWVVLGGVLVAGAIIARRAIAILGGV